MKKLIICAGAIVCIIAPGVVHAYDSNYSRNSTNLNNSVRQARERQQQEYRTERIEREIQQERRRYEQQLERNRTERAMQRERFRRLKRRNY